MRYIVVLPLVFLALLTQAQITSTYDTDADGWTCSDNNHSAPLTVNYNSTGGNPGGYISAGTTSSQPYFFTSPSKFGGNIQYFCYGQELTFDMQLNYSPTTHGGVGDVQISVQSGSKIVLNLSSFPAQAPAWSTHTIRLDETAGWRLGGTAGPLATKADMMQHLSGVLGAYAFRFNIDYTDGTVNTFSGAIDNVVLNQRTILPSPSIGSISLTSGNPGTSVTISGNNFAPVAANNAVYFGGVAGTITSASATSLTVTVPLGAQYGQLTVINKTTGLSKLSEQPFTPTFSDGGRIIPASFAPKFDITITGGYGGLSLADMDGDGWNDLVVASGDNSGIGVYRNLGLGGDLTAASFAARVDFLTGVSGTNGAGLSTTDLDGDGKLDMVTSGWVGGPVGGVFVTFRNTSTPGNLSFESVERWNGRSDESPVYTAVDIDGDGLPELVSGEGAGGAGQNVWITQNMSSPGNIQFSFPLFYFPDTLDDAASGATIRDLNNDGKPEFILKRQFNGAFTVFTNTSTPGTISFGTNFSITASLYGQINVADFNLDGKMDMAWKSGFSNDDVHIRLNTDTDGLLTDTDFATEVILSSDLFYYGALSIADINGDSKPDIVATDGDVGVFENVFSGGAFDASAFIPAYQYQGVGNSSTNPPVPGDLNGDHKPDLVLATSNTTISIFENINVHAPVISLTTVSPLAGTVGSTVTITGNYFSTLPSENTVMFGHVKATVISATKTQLTVTVPAGASTARVSVTRDQLTAVYHLPFVPTFSSGVTFDNTHFAAPVNFTLTSAAYDVDAGDLNNDGKPDVIADVTVAQSYAFRNTHTTGNISATSLAPDDSLNSGPYPHLMDLDGDGNMDMLSGVGPFRNASTGAEINFNTYSYINPGFYYYNDFADFNLDGKTDFIGVFNGTHVSINENQTSFGPFASANNLDINTFSVSYNYLKPGTGGSVVAVDFDKDGLVDFASTNPSTDNVTVWKNNGAYRISTTQFTAQPNITIGDNPSRIYSGDLDLDGKVDLVLYYGAGPNATMITVLHNQSTGTISFNRADYTIPAAATVAHINDLDGDGKPEIIVTSESTDQFFILKNTSTPGVMNVSSFAAAFPTAVNNPRGVTTADLNLDGKPEIILTSAPNSLLVFENLIPMTPPPIITSFTPASGPVGTNVTITGTNFSTTPSNNIVYFGATRATVIAATATELTVTVPPGATYQPISVTVSGLAAFSAKPFDVTFCSVPGISSSSFANPLNFGTGTSSGPVSIAVGDLDGDGKADLAIANRFANTISVLRNTSSAPGNISYAPKIDFATGFEPVSITFGDLDGDGKGDLAVAIFGEFTVSVYRNTSSGPGNISFAPRLDFITGAPGAGPFSVALGDLDKDGKVDMAIANLLSNQASVLLNTSSGAGSISFAARVDFPTGAGAGPYSIFIGDIDLDGNDDLVTSNTNNNSVSVFRNTSSGAGNINYAARINFSTGTTPRSVSIGDLDGDDKLDLAVTAENPDIVSIFRNTSTAGSISFAVRQDFATDFDPWLVAMADLDGDGKVDLATANEGGSNVSVLHNTSTGVGNISFSTNVDFSGGGGLVAVSLGDFDNDGKSEIAAAEFNGDVVSVFRSTIPTATPTITSFSPTSGNAGTFVTILGTNFNTPAPFGVNFNGVNTPIIDFTPTSISVNVPTGATTGPIQVIGCTTVTSASNFTIGSASIIITTQPSDFIACVGQTATFTTAAIGTTNITYQWQFSIDGISFNDIVNGSGYSNTTTAILSVNTTGNFGEGRYRCRINGDFAPEVLTADEGLFFDSPANCNNQPPVIAEKTSAVIIEGIVTIDLLSLISDPDDNLDLATLSVVGSTSEQGALASINASSELVLDYSGILFTGIDHVTIEVCDLSGVCVQQELTIDVVGDVIIYNAISPNPDDNLNNVFTIQYIEVLPDTEKNRVTIYNRWGDVVWEGIDYDNSTVVFDGTSDKGKDLPSGTYFYKIEFTGGRESKTGFLSLKR